VCDRFAGRVSPDELEDLRVIVSELTTNALLHGAGEIHLRVQLDDGVVCGEVLDDGGGFSDTAPATGVGGSGLDLVGALAQRWGVQDGTSRVWFEMAPSGRVRQPVRGDRAVVVQP